MEMIHIQKYIHTTPRKLRLVAQMVRKMEPSHALDTLRFTKKYAAKDLEEAIKVVLANAKIANLTNITFKSIEVNEGPKMRRFKAGTRGRAKPFKRRMAHIKIVLTDQLSDISLQLSEKGQSVVSKPVTDQPRTEKPESENREQKTDNKKKETK